MDPSSKHVATETDLAVRRLIARHSQLADDRTIDALMELYTEDGKAIVNGVAHAGRDALRALVEAGPSPLLHQVTNVVVSYGSHSGTVHAVSDLVLLQQAEGRWVVGARGRYHDTFAGTGGSLRFSQRILTLSD